MRLRSGSGRKIGGIPYVVRKSAAGCRQVVLDGPGGELGASPQVELAQNLADVCLGGPFSDGQLGGNLAVGETARQECDHLLLASGEPFRCDVGEHRRWRFGGGRLEALILSEAGPRPGGGPRRRPRLLLAHLARLPPSRR